MLSLTRTLALALCAAVLAPSLVRAQNNLTSLYGTWSSGSGAVLTGPGFADPMNNDRPFIYPSNTGIAYSFTDDGYFESAQYRFNSNASRPDCPSALLTWQHGTYQLHNNGSLTMTPAPFAEDGRVQTENPCTPQTAILAQFNEFELWNEWSVTIDVNHEAYMLQAVNYNGKLPRLFLTTRPPAMLPTTSLTAIYNGSVPLSA
ncbi:Rot1p [Rhodotorula paludigena]|uniref:Rot1p n=1 Tax=Rhodotorula paludigena TaxID=86838 RepID=UPI0031777233